MDDTEEFNEGFILPTLIRQLKSILEQYPDDGQILKELIQNSEDAGAKHVKFLLDTTIYPANQEKLCHANLAAYQGPALYIYNDAVFSSDDWQGIRMINDSVKEKDPMKVGRFGLGFKSVFHLTDLPSIFSGNGIAYLDPHERFFKVSTYKWYLKKDKEEVQKLCDQFVPYRQELFGVTETTFEEGFYHGTMFRFPLRTDGMQSDLCDTKYNGDKVRELFRSLETDAHIMLLFLKSLQSIEVYEKTSQHENPRKIMSIRVSNAGNDLESKRFQLINGINDRRAGNTVDPVSVTFPLEVEFQQNELPSETSHWVVSHYYAGAADVKPVKSISDDLGFLPWVGVATPIQENLESPSYLSEPRGHIFCFLPLPLEEESPTGLRVHVHGYFAVDSNRRHLKWPTADQPVDQLTDKALIWNEFLVNSLVVKALVKLALHVANPLNKLPPELVFDIVPDQQLLKPQWIHLANEFYKNLPTLNIFQSNASEGNWTNCRDAVFDNCEDRSQLQEIVRGILVQHQVNFVSVPLFLKEHFANSITATMVCQSLKTEQEFLNFTEDETFLLLEYFLDSFPAGSELIGTKLLPLADGTWTEFRRLNDKNIYIESVEHPKALLPGLDKMFLRENIPFLQKLKDLAQKRVTQVVFLDSQAFASKFHLLFPQSWQTSSEVNLAGQPLLTCKWLLNVWEYLSRNFPKRLATFENFHLLPVGNELVMRLKSQQPLLIGSHGGIRLTTAVKAVVRKLGIQVIDSLPAQVLNHPNLVDNFILAPDVTNILLSMKKLFQSGALSVYSLNDADKKALQKFLTAGLAGKRPLVSNYKNLLITLPIFQTLEGSGFKGSEYVSISYVSHASPTDTKFPINLPTAFLDLRANSLKDLADNLDVVQRSAVDILENCIFPVLSAGTYSAEDIVKLMSFVCDSFTHFQESSESFRSSAIKVRFVQKLDGTLVAPSDLFDHSDKELTSLFATDDVFPVGEFANSKYTHVLRQLGLKDQNSVMSTDLLKVAERLSWSDNPDLSCAESLLKFLENHWRLLQSTVIHNQQSVTLSEALSNLRWLRAVSSRPSNYPELLQFVGEKTSNEHVSPREVCAIHYGAVVGSVKATIDTPKIPNVSRIFGWENKPDIHDVIRHLLNVTYSYAGEQKLEYHFTLKSIYKYLDDSMRVVNNGFLVNELRQVNWIWFGEGFTSSSRIVMMKQFMDMQPHVYHIPSDFIEFTHLWRAFEIPENFDLVKTLNEIKCYHEGAPRDETQVTSDLHIAVAILEKIAKMAEKDRILDQLVVPIKSEDGRLLFKMIDEVTYCDKEWYQRGFNSDMMGSGIFLAHPLLHPETAELLKIHGVVSRMLDAEELAFGLESYGQTESLTSRISSILKDYTDGMAVLKELIQNADDAGATEIKFLYDERQNENAKTMLLDKGMASLQGPALWAYNNAVFSEQDFTNLVQLSGATKEQNRDKIGRFGLGFNAVYHLTDVPSLVSQNHIVFLDPHTKFLGSAIRDKSKPGIKLDFKNNRTKLRHLTDQLLPYNGIFGCDFGMDSDMTSYPGTLFRFPLRTQEQARTSEICQKHYSSEKATELLGLLNTSGHCLLLFTQHLKKISVFHIPESASSSENVEEWCTFEKSLDRAIRSIQPANALYPTSAHEASSPFAILNAANDALANMKKQGIVSQVPNFVSSLVVKVSRWQSATASLTGGGNSSSHWLVVSTLGKGTSFEMAKNCSNRIPVGGVAAKLSKSDKGYLPVNLATSEDSDDSGQLFCFLPLPIRSNFPVHINGSFALTSSRAHLCETTVRDMVDEGAQWNEALIQDAITDAYLLLLEDLLKVCTSCNSYDLWPVHKSLTEAGSLSLLTETLYKRIFTDVKFERLCSSSGPKILRENNELLSMSECRFLEPVFRSEHLGMTSLIVLRNMESLDFKITDVPIEVCATIRMTSASKQFDMKMVSKREFFENFLIPNIQTVEAEKRDKLVVGALFDNTLIELLRDVQCIPVKPTRVLRSCSELVNPISFLAVLFDEGENCFPDIQVTSGQTIDDIHRKLSVLGMKESDLSWKEIAERCAKVTEVESVFDARLNAVVKLMSSKQIVVSESESFYIKEITRIRFLPAMEKPRDFPVSWKGDELKFAAPVEIYMKEHKYAVCCKHPICDDIKVFGFENVAVMKTVLGLENKSICQEDLLFVLEECVKVADSAGSVSTLKAESLKHLKEICLKVYEQLDILAKNKVLTETTIGKLLSMQSIFIESSCVFMKPSHCALNLDVKGCSSVNLLPYLGVIPRSLQLQENLLLVLKVKKRFEFEDFVDALSRLNNDSSGYQLKPDMLTASLFIINNCLPERIKRTGGSEDVKINPSKIFVPDDMAVLCSADSLCYNNCPWKIEVEDAHFCHEKVAYSAAGAVGVKTVREDVLDKNSIGMEFGQKEKLVNRLGRILTEYPFEKEVLKEMLQNADDAGATEIHFINDMRYLPDDRVFEDKWKPLQRPALCVFNNKSFSDNDIFGIQNLGEGTKSADPTKTGQYGVGFNSVYHLTDAPTFLASVVGGERVLCAFDPTLRFVPGATESSPGRMMKNIDQLKTKFPDVFRGYFEEQYASLEGAMFRLPLREESTVLEKQGVSNKAVTSADIAQLFKTFKSDMYESLLFLNSIEQIVLKQADRHGELTDVYSVHVELAIEAREKRERFNNEVKSLVKALQRKEISLREVRVVEASYELATVDSEGAKYVWHIIQRFGFEDPSCVLDAVNQAYGKGDIGLLPLCGIAYPKSTTFSPKSCSNKVHKSRLFCFLPLPVPISFPTHVNGHFALDHESRRNLWNNEINDYRTEWNKCLMKNVVAPAYCRLIEEMRDLLIAEGNCKSETSSRYISLFPNPDRIDGQYLDQLSKAIYERIGSRNMAVLPVRWPSNEQYLWIGPLGTDDKSWKIWNQLGWSGPTGIKVLGHFDDLNLQIQEPITSTIAHRFNVIEASVKVKQKKAFELVREILVKCGFLLIDCSMSICRNFKNADVEVQVVSAEAVLLFFASYGMAETMCRVEGLPRPLEKTAIKDLNALKLLLEYCTRCENYKNRLWHLPLLLTADNYLRCFDENVVKFEPFFNEIVPHVQDQFFHHKCFKALNLKTESDIKLCKPFTVKAFAEALPDMLPTHIFRNTDTPVTMNQLLQNLMFDDPKWLSRVWKFLASHLRRRISALPIDAPRTRKPILLKETIEPLCKWCLLPVKFNHQDYLFPLEKSRCVIRLSTSGNLNLLSSALLKIGVPQKLLDYFDALDYFGTDLEPKELYSQLLGTMDDAASVVQAIDEVIRNGGIKTKLTTEESKMFVRYLVEHLNSWMYTPNSMPSVRQLPIFTTVFGKHVALFDYCAYAIPSDIPTVDMESWTSTRGIVFLKYEKQLSELLKFLGCMILSNIEVYCKCIFQHFDLLSTPGQQIHLRYVRDKLFSVLINDPEDEGMNAMQKREEKRDALRESLKKLAFIQAEDGSYECASQFFDNSNEVFSAMHEAADLPPEPYNSDKWNDFLKFSGMISTIDQNMFLCYAKQVEGCARVNIDEKVLTQSQALVKHLFSRDDVSDSSFMRAVKTIKFVKFRPLDPNKQSLCDSYGEINTAGELMLIPFENSIVSQHQDLVWTFQNVLSETVSSLLQLDESRRNIIIESLDIKESAKFETVAKHTNCLCTKWASKVHELRPFFEEVAVVFKNIYRFLRSDESCKSEVMHSCLEDAPFVIDSINCHFVRPNQVVLHMHPDDEISPYLIGIPPDLGEFCELFKLFGSTRDATIDQYVMVLEVIHKAAGNGELDPNEKEAVCKATGGLFMLLQTQSKPIVLKGNLFLPGTDNRMHKSSEILFDNDRDLRSRLKDFKHIFLIDLQKECNLLMTQRELERQIQMFPAESQPKFLTSVVTERMENEFSRENSKFVKELARKLQSVELKAGIVRLAWHRVEKHSQARERQIKEAAEDIQNIRIVGVDTVHTYLVYEGARITGSEASQPLHFRQEVVDDEMCCTIFVNSRRPKLHNLLLFYHKFAGILQHVADHILSDAAVSILKDILKSKEKDIEDMLNNCGVSMSPQSKVAEYSFRPKPGDFVPLDLHHLLKQDILLLKLRDFVALETDDPMDADIDSATEHLVSEGENPTEPAFQEPTYIMVKIIEVLKEDSEKINLRYKIEDGNGVRTVAAVLLYAFHRTVTDATNVDAIIEAENAQSDVVWELDDARRLIKQTLEDAWKLPDETLRRKYVRRLLLQWHPDKNLHQEQVAHDATLYIIELIAKLEKGISLDDDQRSTHSTSDGCYNNCSSEYTPSGYYSGAYYNYINKRARKHRETRERYKRNLEQNTQNVAERRKRDFLNSFTTGRNPQPGEGRRWLRQAEWDLKAARNDTTGGMYPCGEWACFKSHQAALKALQGAQYARDANVMLDENLRDAASRFEERCLREWTYELLKHVSNQSHMQYPSNHQHPTIPHDVFDEYKVQKALELSQNILTWCKNDIG